MIHYIATVVVLSVPVSWTCVRLAIPLLRRSEEGIAAPLTLASAGAFLMCIIAAVWAAVGRAAVSAASLARFWAIASAALVIALKVTDAGRQAVGTGEAAEAQRAARAPQAAGATRRVAVRFAARAARAARSAGSAMAGLARAFANSAARVGRAVRWAAGIGSGGAAGAAAMCRRASAGLARVRARIQAAAQARAHVRAQARAEAKARAQAEAEVRASAAQAAHAAQVAQATRAAEGAEAARDTRLAPARLGEVAATVDRAPAPDAGRRHEPTLPAAPSAPSALTAPSGPVAPPGVYHITSGDIDGQLKAVMAQLCRADVVRDPERRRQLIELQRRLHAMQAAQAAATANSGVDPDSVERVYTQRTDRLNALLGRELTDDSRT